MVIMAAANEWVSEGDFAAEMTSRQFAALRVRLNKEEMATELRALLRSGPRRITRDCESDEVAKWAMNDWNTEQILRLSPTLLPPEQLVNALQWPFASVLLSLRFWSGDLQDHW
jgi:hypothetical protein